MRIDRPRGCLRACAIADIGATVHRIHVIRRQKSTLSIAARRFLDELRMPAGKLPARP
ncbi:MAG: hypothetical protein V4645_27765 [Pseudomonadota bacterium]